MTSPYDGDRSGATGRQRQPAGATLPPELDPRGPGGPRRPEPGASGQPPPRRRRRKLRWALGGTAGVITLIVVFLAVAVLVAVGKIGHFNPFGFKQAKDLASGDQNILVVGSDSRAGLTKAEQNQLHVGHDPGARTDTMMLVHVPAGSGKATIVSLPRDSYVTIPAHRQDGHQVPAAANKLNAAYAEGGIDLLTHTVEDATGIHLDHVVQINFEGFVKMVNALGGVTVCTDTPINDPVRPNPDGSGYIGSGLKLPAGSTSVNGITALEYVRAREFDPTEDLGRMRRQQEFIADLIHKVESAGTLLNPLKVNSLLQAVGSSLKTDSGFGLTSMAGLLERFHSISPSKVQLMTVPLANPSSPSVEKNVGGTLTSVVQWDPTQSKVLFGDLSRDRPVKLAGAHKVTVAPSSISLKVLNATSTQGLAAKAATSLAGRGFQISGTGNAPKGASPAHTVVLYGGSRQQSAQTVKASVPGSTMQLDNALGANGLELVVGSNYSGTAAVKVASSNTPVVNTAAGKQCQTA